MFLAAKSKPGKDAGSVRIQGIRARLRTPSGAALQPTGRERTSGREHLTTPREEIALGRTDDLDRGPVQVGQEL